MAVEGVAVVGDSEGIGVAGWRRFAQPSVRVGGWKTSNVVVEVLLFIFVFLRIVETVRVIYLWFL